MHGAASLFVLCIKPLSLYEELLVMEPHVKVTEKLHATDRVFAKIQIGLNFFS